MRTKPCHWIAFENFFGSKIIELLKSLRVIISKDLLNLFCSHFLAAILREADDLVERIVLDMLLEAHTATIDAEAVFAIQLYSDVIGNRRVTLLNLIQVTNRTVV